MEDEGSSSVQDSVSCSTVEDSESCSSVEDSDEDTNFEPGQLWLKRDEDDHDEREHPRAFRHFYNLSIGDITVDQIPNKKLLAVAKHCCKNYKRELYFEVMRKIHEVTDQMAEDVYDVFVAITIGGMYWAIEEWFKNIGKHFSNTEWQSGKVIPMPLMIWREKATENALKSDNVFLDDGETGTEYVMFLPLNLLLDHLATYLSKNARKRVQYHLLSKYPRHIRQFLRDSECLQNVSNRDVLSDLLKLASEFEIEALYFRAYARMVLLDLPLDYIPPLHLHKFSAEEVLEQKKNDQSPFTKLIAKDGSSAKVLEKDLLKKSDYFRAWLAFDSLQTLSEVKSICKNIKVLNTWIQFLHNDKFSNETKDQTLVDLIEVADFYQIDGMLFEVLSKLNTGLRHDSARIVYDHFPFHYEEIQNDQLNELIQLMKERMEKDFLEEISDSQGFISFFLSNKCLRELEGVDKLFEIELVSSCGIILYQESSKYNYTFFNFDSDYNFEQIFMDSLNTEWPLGRVYLHQRKLFSLNGEDTFVLYPDKFKVDVSKPYLSSFTYKFYLGTLYAIENTVGDKEVTIKKYDIEGNRWINMKNSIYKHVPINFRGNYLVFGDLLVFIFKDDWVAYLKPSPREDFELELNCFETSYPKNTFKNVIGIHKKKMKKKKYFWFVFQSRSFLILRADDLTLLAEVELPLINNRPWSKAIFSGEQVYLVLKLEYNSNTYLDIYEAKIELNEGNFENTEVKMIVVIKSRKYYSSEHASMGVIDRIVVD